MSRFFVSIVVVLSVFILAATLPGWAQERQICLHMESGQMCPAMRDAGAVSRPGQGFTLQRALATPQGAVPAPAVTAPASITRVGAPDVVRPYPLVVEPGVFATSVPPVLNAETWQRGSSGISGAPYPFVVSYPPSTGARQHGRSGSH